MAKIAVIGSGVSGLSAACFLAYQGHKVDLFERHDMIGGRARIWRDQGFTFDMGPSWYWMPDIYERFFASFASSVADHYTLVRLDPSYRVFWSGGEIIDLPASMGELEELFERWEPGSALRLRDFLRVARHTYEKGMGSYAFRPSLGPSEFLDLELLRESIRLGLFRSLRSHVASYFSHPLLRQLVEFPVLFLGAGAERIPALYSLMTYADMALGTWYPMGGMYRVIEGMGSVAAALGVNIVTNAPVSEIVTRGRKAVAVRVCGSEVGADAVVCAADYHHGEMDLLPAESRSYSQKYWQTRTLAPSCVLFYLGVKGRVKGLQHHNLFFDESLDVHSRDIYTQPRWPQKPLFYVCAPSKTDPSVAPSDNENLFVLIPVAPGLNAEPEILEGYFQYALGKLLAWTGEDISSRILVKRVYCGTDFLRDYSALRGNAYGLANTLLQTAWLKPKLRSKRVGRLYFTGQLTVPGPGVPPCLISGEVVAGVIAKDFSRALV